MVLDLNPATWYNLLITAHNNAGLSVAEYEFPTLTATGGTLAPAREITSTASNLQIQQLCFHYWFLCNVYDALCIFLLGDVAWICLSLMRPNILLFEKMHTQFSAPKGA